MNKKVNIDRIEQIGKYGEIILPIGHYALVNSKYKSNYLPIKISIYGLGSCIALILFDMKNKVSGMSHILLPKANPNKEIKFPHKYADLSVKLLIKELLSHGAERKNMKAFIVGGSKIFDLDENIIGDDNAKIVKRQLKKFNIKIVNEDVGGSLGRVIIFDAYDYSVFVKSSDESEFRKL